MPGLAKAQENGRFAANYPRLLCRSLAAFYKEFELGSCISTSCRLLSMLYFDDTVAV